MKKRIIALILGLAMAMSVLVACGSSSGTTTAAPADTTAQAETTESAAAETTAEASAATHVVTDMKGVEVELPVEITGYVESWFAHNAVDVMLNKASEMLVTCCDPDSYKWMYTVCPNMENAEYMKFSADMDIETIIAMEPDVVFGSNEDYRELFNNVGIPFVNCAFNTYDTMIQSIQLTASVFGGEAEDIAEEYVAYLEEKLDWVADTVSSVAEEDKPYILHGSSVYNKGVDGVDTIIDEWIKYSGGLNVASKDITGNLQEFEMEQLYSWDPEIIITGSDEAEVESIMSDPDWAELTAVKEGNVIANPKGIFAWDRYGVEEALQFQWCASTLYPELFADFDIKDELISFYKEFLDYDLSDEDAQKILRHMDPDEEL